MKEPVVGQKVRTYTKGTVTVDNVFPSYVVLRYGKGEKQTFSLSRGAFQRLLASPPPVGYRSKEKVK